jgi:beta-lactam-binding protein with PASTA domain
LGTGTGVFAEGPTINVTSRPTSVAIGDFNQDRRVDLAVSLSAGTNILYSLNNSQTTVPNVVDLPQAAAQSAITAAGLVLGTVTLTASTTVPAGTVVSESPVATTSVAQGRMVDLVVSAGPPISVPDVVGLTQDAAESAITAADLRVGIVTVTTSETVPIGSVIGESPSGGALVVRGTAVDLLVSSGPPPVNIPNVVGLTQAAAQSIITNARLTLGAVTKISRFAIPAGTVITQNPAAGSSAPQGTPIAIVVSSGPPLPSSFSQPSAFAVGLTPFSLDGHGLAGADFNADGELDLAIVNYGAGTVSILLGRGDGTFEPAIHARVGRNPISVAAGDFNGDGKADLAIVNYTSNAVGCSTPCNSTVSILLGHGDGTFAAVADFTVGRNPTSVAIGDFNDDGISDLAVTNGFDASVSILLGHGDGFFGPADEFPVRFVPVALAVGDFNSDGKPDLAVVNGSDISILVGRGDGSVGLDTDFALGNHPTALSVGDFDGDGKLDIAVATYNTATISTMRGQGEGTFGPTKTFPVGANPTSIAIGDFNVDGNLDLAVVSEFRSAVSVLFGDGTGSFGAAPTLELRGRPNSVAIGDFNGDGRQDIAVTNVDGNEVFIIMNVP